MRRLTILLVISGLVAGLMAACASDQACAAPSSGGARSGGSGSGGVRSPAPSPVGKPSGSSSGKPSGSPTGKPSGSASNPKPVNPGKMPEAPKTQDRLSPPSGSRITYVPRPSDGVYGDPYDPVNPLNRWNAASPYYWYFWPDTNPDYRPPCAPEGASDDETEVPADKPPENATTTIAAR